MYKCRLPLFIYYLYHYKYYYEHSSYTTWNALYIRKISNCANVIIKLEQNNFTKDFLQITSIKELCSFRGISLVMNDLIYHNPLRTFKEITQSKIDQQVLKFKFLLNRFTWIYLGEIKSIVEKKSLSKNRGFFCTWHPDLVEAFLIFRWEVPQYWTPTSRLDLFSITQKIFGGKVKIR